MKKTSEPIVFFGSGPVAAESLRLLAQDFAIEAVVTKPRAQHHRGDVPVLALAEELRLPVRTVSTKSELRELFAAKPFTAKLGVLIDFGIIVPKAVIDYFPLGIINSHFSVLPEWRGADPITFSILSGQKITGVSLMFLVEAMDEGPLLAHVEHPISDGTTTPSLTHELIGVSYRLLQQELPKLFGGRFIRVFQGTTRRATSYSRKLTKEDGVLDWHKPAAQLEREIRAFIDWPKSRTTLGDKDVIVTKAHVVPGNSTELQPGDVETSLIEDGVLMVETGDGKLCIDELKPAGKQAMTSKAFLAGHKQLFARG